jgi:hypothetical protein
VLCAHRGLGKTSFSVDFSTLTPRKKMKKKKKKKNKEEKKESTGTPEAGAAAAAAAAEEGEGPLPPADWKDFHSLAGVARRLGHSGRALQVLKVDVEGAEVRQAGSQSVFL